MKMRIGCVDGNTYETDEVSDEDIQEYLDSVDGKIGTGFLEDTRVYTVDEFAEFMDRMLKNDLGPDGSDVNYVTLRMNDNDKVFQYDKIVWHEIIR